MNSNNIVVNFRDLIEKYKELENEQYLIFELNTAEVHTILLIGQNPNINVNTIAQLRNVTRNAASQMINKLYKNGYLTKQISPIILMMT